MADFSGALQIKKVTVSATESLSPLLKILCRQTAYSPRLKVKTSFFVCVF